MLARLRQQVVSVGFKRYFFNTSWMMAEQGLRLISSFFIGVYVARYLGPEKFGIYSYALAFVSIFGAVAKLGLDSIVVRELVKAPEERDQLLGTAYWLKLLGGFLAVVLILAVLVCTSNNAVTNIYISIIAVGLVFQSFDVVDLYYQSLVRVKYVSICKTVQLLVSALLKLFLVFIEADLLFFVIVTLVDQILLAVAYFFLARLHKFEPAFFIFKPDRALSYLKDSWPLIFSAIAVMLYMRIDQVMLGKMLGDEAVGLYSVAIRIGEIWCFIPMAIISTVYPSIVKDKSIDQSRYYDKLQKLYSIVVLMALSVALPVSFFSELIVVTLFGFDYKNAGIVLAIHVWTGVFTSLGVASGKWFLMENMSNLMLYRTALGAVINIVLNLYLIPLYGVVGAAVATFISYSVAGYWFDLINKRTRCSFFMKTNAFLFSRLFRG